MLDVGGTHLERFDDAKALVQFRHGESIQKVHIAAQYQTEKLCRGLFSWLCLFCSTDLNVKQRSQELEIQKMPVSFYSRFCNHWASLVGVSHASDISNVYCFPAGNTQDHLLGW